MTSIDRSLAASGPIRADIRARQAAKPPRRRLSWGDPFTRGLIYQAGLAVLLALGIYALYSNVSENLQRQNIATGFSFLEQLARFNIGESPIPYSASDTYGRALLVGVLNTLRVAAVAIVFATVLGVAAGVARASRNVVISTLAGTYVELARNVPIILHVLLWSSIIRNLPPPRQAHDLLGIGFISNRGLTVPLPGFGTSGGTIMIALGVAVLSAFAAARLARRYGERTGRYVEPVVPALAVLVALPLLTWIVTGAQFTPDIPQRRGFGFTGGLTLSPEFFALAIGLTIYTGAFIAEIVRGGIQAVPKGQVEAARALGLHPFSIMTRIVLPQALRVIVPPLSSQFLSLTKNSSLGVIIGYPELVNIGNTVMNQTGQAMEMVTIMMLIYFTLSLITSLLMNFYNSRVALKGR
jgi:general L-amino acid transport system permease protein